jgi:glutamyl-tRNA synthetase
MIPEHPDASLKSNIERVIQAVGDRLKIFSDILDYKEFFVSDEAMTFDEKPFQQRIREASDAKELLLAVREQLSTVDPYDAPTLDKLVHDFVEQRGIKIGQIVHALRVAVTGKSVGIGLFDALAILGRESSIKRIDRALSLV